jgi:hypothetical protein
MHLQGLIINLVVMYVVDITASYLVSGVSVASIYRPALYSSTHPVRNGACSVSYKRAASVIRY